MDINTNHGNEYNGLGRTNLTNLINTTKAIDLLVKISGNHYQGQVPLFDLFGRPTLLEYDHSQNTYRLYYQGHQGIHGFSFNSDEFLLGIITVFTPQIEGSVNLHTLSGDQPKGTEINLLLIDLQSAIWNELRKVIDHEHRGEFDQLIEKYEGYSHQFMEQIRELVRDRFTPCKEQ